MLDALAEEGVWIDEFYFGPFHGKGVVPRYTVEAHPDRRPKPSMTERAFNEWQLRRQGSFLIGDTDPDLAAAGLPGYRYSGGDLDALVAQAIADSSAAREQ
jgi:D-glycero-D-manno-heptose 1,7-bisphosphate phosphatase